MISRRAWLKMAGASVLLPLFARDVRPARASGAPRTRLILLMQSNGTSQSSFWPDPALWSIILDPITGNPSLGKKTTIVRGLYDHAGGAGNAHDQGFAGLYSGFRTVGTFDDPWGGGPSIDQLLAQRLTINAPYPTLNCGVLASDVPPFKDHRASFSYLGARQQIPAKTDPYRLFADLFAPAQDPAAVQRRLAQRQSVLDFATADLRALRGRLGQAERDKLDVHEGALRDYERRLSYYATAKPIAAGAPAAGLDPKNEDHVPALAATMIDLVALAAANNLAQIVTMPFGHGGEKWRFRWLGINQDTHAVAHRDDGKTAEVTAILVQMNRWYAQQVARLALALDSIPEGDGTALDHTLIVWGNEQATGQHGQDDIPIVLIGGASGQLAGGRVVDKGPQTYHRLGCSLMGLMGAEAPGFGEEPTCGGIDGLL